MAHNVVVLVGSLRKDGFTLRLAQALATLAGNRMNFHVVPIGNIPLYNEDLDENPPETWTNFRLTLQAANAVLFVTPEYNRSVPSALKNAIDVGSRPYGHNSFKKKPAAVVSQSPGTVGGFGANHAIRQSLVFLDMPTLQQPEVYLAHSDKLLGTGGKILNDGTRTFLTNFVDTFGDWVDLHALAGSAV